MRFDDLTMLLVVTLVTALSTIARFLLCRLHPTMSGLSRWAWASAVGTVALVLIIVHHFAPHRLLLSGSQALFIVGLVLTWDGFRRFGELSPLSTRSLAAITVVAALPMLISASVRWPGAPVAINGALFLVIAVLLTRDLFLIASPTATTLRVTAWIYALNAAFILLRLSTAVWSGSITRPDFANFGAPTSFWWLGTLLAITLCMILMTGERLQRDLSEQASRDPLTGAMNRRAFTSLAHKEVARARRSATPLSMLVIDFDRFKQINDLLGHAAGDSMLCLLVTLGARVLRDEDTLCRFGGEEFVALLPGSGSEEAVAVAERLRLQFLEAAETALAASVTALPFGVTISIGVGELGAGEDIDQVIRRADAALYRAKAAGRNRVERS